MQDIERKLIHIKLRPTYTNINYVCILLKQNGYTDIPKLIIQENNTIDVIDFCNKVKNIISKPPTMHYPSPKNNKKNTMFMFQESSLLPKNVYVSEKDEEDKLDEKYIQNEASSISESEISENSDKEVYEEGYELYESGDDSEWSE